MDHKQKKCLQEKSTRRSSYEDDVEDAYKKAMRRALKRETKMVMIKDIMRLPTTSGKNIISNS